MEIIFVYLLLAAGVGVLANSRGRSGFGFFLLSAFLSPLLGLIVVLITKNKVEDEKKEQLRKEERERHIESIRAIASRSDPAASSSGQRGVTHSIADELAKLAELRDKGVLNDSEFQSQKAALLLLKQ